MIAWAGYFMAFVGFPILICVSATVKFQAKDYY